MGVIQQYVFWLDLYLTLLANIDVFTAIQYHARSTLC